MLYLLVYSSSGDSVTPPIKLLGCKEKCKCNSARGCGAKPQSHKNLGYGLWSEMNGKLITCEILSYLALRLSVVENVDVDTQFI